VVGSAIMRIVDAESAADDLEERLESFLAELTRRRGASAGEPRSAK
jgi:hypothetical protein